MKIHEEHKFQLVHIIRIDEMRTDHSFGHRVPIQLYNIFCPSGITHMVEVQLLKIDAVVVDLWQDPLRSK